MIPEGGVHGGVRPSLPHNPGNARGVAGVCTCIFLHVCACVREHAIEGQRPHGMGYMGCQKLKGVENRGFLSDSGSHQDSEQAGLLLPFPRSSPKELERKN